MKIQNQRKIKEKKGITLIALVITIIVLLILAGVSIAALTGQGNILENAGNAKQKTQRANLIESAQIDIFSEQQKTQDGNISTEKLRDILSKFFDGVPKTDEEFEENFLENPDYSLKSKPEYGGQDIEVADVYKESLPGSNGPKVEIGGKTKTLTEKNVKDYLGKVVTNFKEDYENGTEEVNGITVSKKYRLYYVDFANKYGDGEGTMYIKAEFNHNIRGIKRDQEHTAESSGVRTKQLNPSLYAEGKIAPTETNKNMQAVTWLLNENNWLESKGNLKVGGIRQEDINYIVGAPSLEMMMDSYNIFYGLTGETSTDSSLRKKLFYQYENGNYGYKVGPGETENFANSTASSTVPRDYDRGVMYYCTTDYWLASPSAWAEDSLCYVSHTQGGVISYNEYYQTQLPMCVCPLVSLKSTVKLELEE